VVAVVMVAGVDSVSSFEDCDVDAFMDARLILDGDFGGSPDDKEGLSRHGLMGGLPCLFLWTLLSSFPSATISF